MPRVLHVLPHPGGGGEAVVDMVSRLGEHEHRRIHLAQARTPLGAAPSLAVGLARLRAEARSADLLHVIGDTSALLTAPAMRDRPAVWGTHGLHLLRRAGGPAGALARRRARVAVAAAEATICSSASERDDLARIVGGGLAPRLVEVVNGVDLPPAPANRGAARAAARVALGLPADARVVLLLGEVVERKRPRVAVAAAERAATGGAAVVLLVAGDGPLREELAARAGDAVRVLGFRRDIDRLLAAADVFAMPSAREGLSLALLEAMGAGLAIVASDGPGHPEAIGGAGVLHPVDDVAALADALGRLARDPEERERLAAAARARAEERFTAERFLDDMRAVFADALAVRAPGRAGVAGPA